MNVIELKNISKKYGKATVVDNFSLNVEKGHICGLIGPNGAGKTTIMKMMAGLASPTSGEIGFFGKNDNLDLSRKRMAFMLEAPIIDKSMNARQNMEYVRYVKGVADKKKIDEMLDFVGLHDVGKKAAGKFSLGMTQRLGIAMALLTEPEIMVLDEPVNGLDPEGIVEIRELLLKLNREDHITIIISSHILSELSLLCTDYIFINKGEILQTVSAPELKKICKEYYRIDTDNNNLAAAVLQNKLELSQFDVDKDGTIKLYEGLENIRDISKTLFENGVIPTTLAMNEANLEQYYMNMVGEENAEHNKVTAVSDKKR